MTVPDDFLGLPQGVGPLNITFDELEDGSLQLNWDENDPAAIALGVNDWTAEQWIVLLKEGLEQKESEDQPAADE